MDNYVDGSINNIQNNDVLEYAIKEINNYPEDVLKVVIKLLNIRYDPKTKQEYENYIRTHIIADKNIWLFSFNKLSTEERQLLLEYDLWSDALPTNKLYTLEDLITSIMGWKWWECIDVEVATKKLKEAVASGGVVNKDHISGGFESGNATLCHFENNVATTCHFESGNATLCHFENNVATLCHQLLHNNSNDDIVNEICEKIGERANQLKSGFRQFKKDNCISSAKIFTILTFEGIPYSEFENKATKLLNKSSSTIKHYLKIYKKLEWIDIRRNPNDFDKKYIYLTYKFYEDVKDILDQYLPKKAYSESESKSEFMEDLKKSLKKFIEERLTYEGFEFDINEVDKLEGKDRVIGAYFRDLILNEPYEVIEMIYKVYYEKFFKYRPLEINIIGLETLRSRDLTKSTNWSNFKDKLIIISGDIEGVIEYKVERLILRVYECEGDDKTEGCGRRYYRYVEPLPNKKVKVFCKCGRELKKSHSIIKDDEGNEVDLSSMQTVILLQLKNTDELYPVYVPYLKDIHELRNITVVGVLKTDNVGKYYIEGLCVNPKKVEEFNYEAFVRKVKDAGYSNALDYIKDTVFYEVKAILDPEGNPTIDTLITLEVLACSHICWDKYGNGHLNPQTIDALVVGNYGMGKSLTAGPLAKLQNASIENIKISSNTNINNLIGMVITDVEPKHYKRGLLPMNHNRVVVFEEFIDLLTKLKKEIDALKDGKTTGYYKREIGGNNHVAIGVSPWICLGNINPKYMELWDVYFNRGVWAYTCKLREYFRDLLLKKGDEATITYEEAEKQAKKIVNNIIDKYGLEKSILWLLYKILEDTNSKLFGMTDRITLIYLLRPYSNEELRAIELHKYKIQKLKESKEFRDKKELEIRECALFIEHIKNEDVPIPEDVYNTLIDIKEQLRDALKECGLMKWYSDFRLFNQIEYMAKAFAKLKFKRAVDLEDVKDAVKLWFKSLLGIILQLNKDEENIKSKLDKINELLEGKKDNEDKKDDYVDNITNKLEISKEVKELKQSILNYMLQNPKTYTTVEIAEKFNISEDTARGILKELWKNGDVDNPESDQWRPL